MKQKSRTQFSACFTSTSLSQLLSQLLFVCFTPEPETSLNFDLLYFTHELESCLVEIVKSDHHTRTNVDFLTLCPMFVIRVDMLEH